MELFSLVILLFLGTFTGILAALIGIGGGLVFVPALIVIFSVIPNDATLISSFVIIFTSMSGSVQYMRLKRIDYKTAFVYALFAIPGSILGGISSEVIDPTLLRQIFGVVIIIYAVRGLYRTNNQYQAKKQRLADENAPKKNENKPKMKDGVNPNRSFKDSEGTEYAYFANTKVGTFFAFVGGFLAGLLGLGGGIIFVPLLASITGVPFLIVVSTSTFIIFLNSFTVVIARMIFQYFQGAVDLQLIYDFGLPLTIGSVIGAYFGAGISKRIGTIGLSFIFWIVALIASFRILF